MHVTLVRGDGGDWEGLYRNGILSDQNHSLDLRAVLESLANQGSIHFAYIRVDQDWLEGELGLPYNLNEIPQEVRITCS